MNPPHVLGFPPSPSDFRDAAHGMGMDIFWNHPMQLDAMFSRFSQYYYLLEVSLNQKCHR